VSTISSMTNSRSLCSPGRCCGWGGVDASGWTMATEGRRGGPLRLLTKTGGEREGGIVLPGHVSRVDMTGDNCSLCSSCHVSSLDRQIIMLGRFLPNRHRTSLLSGVRLDVRIQA
jgi:hypothetical protein